MKGHLRFSLDGHKNRWLAQLKRTGLRPTVQVLEECTTNDWQTRERQWIADCKAAGEPLTNETEGGEGLTSLVLKMMWSDSEYHARISASIRAAYTKPEVLERLAEATRASWDDPKARANRMTGIRSYCAEPEDHDRRIAAANKCRDRISASVTAMWADPEHRAREMARRSTPEARARISAGKRDEWARRKAAQAEANRALPDGNAHSQQKEYAP